MGEARTYTHRGAMYTVPWGDRLRFPAHIGPEGWTRPLPAPTDWTRVPLGVCVAPAWSQSSLGPHTAGGVQGVSGVICGGTDQDGDSTGSHGDWGGLECSDHSGCGNVCWDHMGFGSLYPQPAQPEGTVELC